MNCDLLGGGAEGDVFYVPRLNILKMHKHVLFSDIDSENLHASHSNDADVGKDPT
jgi:hypothetical protein